MNKKTLERELINYTNTFVFHNASLIPYNMIGGNKKYVIEYKEHTYEFIQLHNDMDKLILYSYDNMDDDCVILSIMKKEKVINLDSFGKKSKCYHGEIDIGSNLLKLTLKMIKNNKDKLGINKITLSDNATYPCETGERINLSKMMILLTGDTWFGKHGFIPYNNIDFKPNKQGIKIYEMNKKIATTILLKDIALKKYLLMIYKKYPDEMPIKLINTILIKEANKPEQLLIDFLNKFHKKSKFAFTCKWFRCYYEKLFDDLGLQITGHFYGLSYL